MGGRPAGLISPRNEVRSEATKVLKACTPTGFAEPHC